MSTSSSLVIRGKKMMSKDEIKTSEDYIHVRINILSTLSFNSYYSSSSSLIRYKLLSNWQPLIKHSSLYVLDCGRDGDCLFHCLAAGYNQLIHEWKYSMMMMRTIAANQINISFLKEFCIAESLPLHLSVTAVQNIIKTSGNTYWGSDSTLIYLLLHAPEFQQYHIGFVVLTFLKKEKKFVTQLLGFQNETQLLMLLYCDHPNHWYLLGIRHPSSSLIICSTVHIHQFPKILMNF